MNNMFEAGVLSVKQVFESGYYEIPDYQRPYAWEREEMEQLWKDIESARNSKEEDKRGKGGSYFLGAFVTVAGKDDTMEVVDGQQRLTTLMILLSAIRHLYSTKDSKSQQEVSEVIVGNIRNCTYEAGLENDRVRVRLMHRSSFEDESDGEYSFRLSILDGKAFEGEVVMQVDKLGESEKNFRVAARLFKEKLGELEKKADGSVEGFANYLLDKVCLVRVVCENAIFSNKLFNVLNNRGRDLTVSDLIKSGMIEMLYKRHGTDAEGKRSSIVNSWRDVEKIVTEKRTFDMGCDMTTLLRMYAYYQRPKRMETGFTAEMFFDCLKEEDPSAAVSNIKGFADCWRQLVDSQDNVRYLLSYSGKLWLHWQVIFTGACHCKYDELVELRKCVLRYYYMIFLGGKGKWDSKLEVPLFGVVERVKEKKGADDIRKYLKESALSCDIAKPAYEALQSGRIGDKMFTRQAKMLLALLEHYQPDMQGKGGTKIKFKETNLEHVLPQTYKGTAWEEHFSEQQFEDCVNSLGNLTLLGKNANIASSNLSFDDKIEKYKGTDSNRGQTPFFLTQEIISHHKTWTPETIKERERKLIQRLTDIIFVDFSDEERGNLLR